MRIPNLYLKWHAFRELTDAVDTDKDVGIHLYKHDDGAEPFAKLLRGDLSCATDIAAGLSAYMNRRIASLNARTSPNKARTPQIPGGLTASDLQAPTMTFVAKLLELLGEVPEDRLDRAHAALLRDMQVVAPQSNEPRLVIEQFAMDRSFAGVLPSGGAGPLVFEAGKHRGQLAVIGVAEQPLAAYTMFTRDPALSGQRIWHLAWGEAVLWLPSPSVPPLVEGRLLLMPQPHPVQAVPGRFNVTTSLIWRQDALNALEPRTGSPKPDALDETQTALFLTRLRRIIDDKRRRWEGAVTALSVTYDVKV